MSATPKPIAETLIATAARIREISNNHVFRPMGLSSASFYILRLLAKVGLQTPSAILKQVGNTKSNLSQRLESLESKGLIIRKLPPTSSDGRTVVVTLTDAGAELVKRVNGKFLKACTALEQQFSAEELDNYFSFMEKLNQTFDAYKAEIPELFKE